MRVDRIGVCIIVGFAIIMAMSASADAAQRKMLVLIDASGSMSATRPLPPPAPPGATTTRFEDAKAAARGRINLLASDPMADPLKVAVYTFQGNNLAPVQYTAGFVDVNTALDAIDCLTSSPAPSCAANGVPPLQYGGVTPLARAMCAAADILVGAAGTGDTKILSIASDGLENSTTSAPCAGPFGSYDGSQYVPADSWQNRVINYFTGKSIATAVDLFEIRNLPLTGKGMPDPEGKLTTEGHLKAITPSPGFALSPLAQFFTVFVQTTGGSLNVVLDDEPLPVTGDIDGDLCVSRADAILVAKAFGQAISSANGKYDHNLNGVIDFADYQIQSSLINPACGPDPYVKRGPLVCTYEELEIDGAAIEGSGAAIEVRGWCRVKITNSLIVGGQSALKLLETGVVSIENSIVIGAGAALSVPSGSPALCASNTLFDGLVNIIGSLYFQDHGGNIWQ